VLALALVGKLFVAAVTISRVVVRMAGTVIEVGDPGTVSNLVVGVVGLQLAGFGTVTLLDVAPAESAGGRATDTVLYLVLLAVSTLVAVPMEELFFRDVVQRYVEDRFHAGVAIGVASLLFVPLIGHALYNGVQIIPGAVKVAR
jgi:membrane protease YdiL (CAAX protease family)